MSRIGKLPIKIPKGVQVLFKKEKSLLNLTGKFGSLELQIPKELIIVPWRSESEIMKNSIGVIAYDRFLSVRFNSKIINKIRTND